MDHEYGALLGGQPTKASGQLVTHGGQLLGVAMPPCVGRGHVDLHDPAPLDPPRLPIAGVDEEPIEPGVETIGVADGADVQPGGRERVLDCIGRPVVASQDQPRRSVQPTERFRGKAVKASWSPFLARRTRSRCIGHPARRGRRPPYPS